MSNLGGLVLIGGHSRRMGTDKAALPWGGGTLLEHQIATLRAADADPVMVAGRADQTAPLSDLPWVTDEPGVAGPLAGLLAGLTACPADFLAVLAVDLPRFPAELFKAWHQAAIPGCGWIIQGEKGFEPLAALYPKTALASLRDGAAQGVFRLQSHLLTLIESGHMRIWSEPLPSKDCLANWNSPADMR